MKLIVIGHGMVGHKFLECIAAEAGATGAPQVTVLGEEPRPAYDRVHLSEFFAGKSADDLSLVEPGFFERHPQFDLRLNAPVASIDRAAHTVTLASGETLAYDKLVLATGSRPFVPPMPGHDRDGCFVYRTIEDLEAMQACGTHAKRGVVIGGGLLGLECAKALRDMGLDTVAAACCARRSRRSA
jgi:nitrite reductase (NADH) large subunit